jgi:HAD superfamily hydrolase (TIGR01509 family)
VSNRWLIFDFDGVIADSEVLANCVLAEIVTALGVATTLEDSYRLFMGKRFPDVIAAIQTAVGRELPETFPADYQSRTLACFRKELRPVQGARAYIDAFAHLQRCIASSSSADRLALCLDVLGLEHVFAGNVFSGSQVARGKPHPDIFLHAARAMNEAPARAIVLEDSVAGVQAGVAAGMTVIGILAGSHIQKGYHEELRAAGAHHVAATFAEAETITRALSMS